MSKEEAMDDRLKILLDQLDAVWEMLDARLSERKPFGSEPGSAQSTLTDEEYFWEPAPDCWSLRRRGQGKGPHPRGKGDWQLDGGYPPPDPSPFTTIAWRMCHLCASPLLRYDYTFGGHSLTLDDVTWPATADEAVAFVRNSHLQWRNAIEGVTSADLDQIGRSQMPQGLDPQVRFADLIAWTNLEFGHHAAEVACLRDLYRAKV
jgi:hypothetical protein